MKKILILFICTVLLFSLIACDNNPQQDQPNTDIPEINNQENEDENLSQENSFESKLLPSATFLGRYAYFAVIDNEIKGLSRQKCEETYKNQVFAIKCDRFAFLKDGSVIDLCRRKQNPRY